MNLSKLGRTAFAFVLLFSILLFGEEKREIQLSLGESSADSSNPQVVEERSTLSATHNSEKITIDGLLSEEVWLKAEKLDIFYQFEPHYNEPASLPTILRAAYDEKNLYFAFDCKDPEPARITARATKRDGDVLEDDAVAIALDTFDDNNSAYMFAINPLATQQDGRFADNGRTTDMNWDETWYAAAHVYEGGWTCEIAIPLKSLKYNQNLTSWGFSAGRWIARLKEKHFISKDLVATTRVSQFGTLTSLQLKNFSVKNYTIIPYMQGEFEQGEAPVSNTGVDVRYNPVSNLGLSFTINPDFATIEGDVEQVNLTRFELSYPEKRPFFLEGAENYSTRIRQFYSRRIGEIPWGAQVNGKVGKWNLNGLMTTSDPSTAGAEPESGQEALYSVFRVNSELKGGSTIGLIGANRTYKGNNSGSLGLSGTLFFTDVLGMTTQLIKSHGSSSEGTWTGFLRPAYDTQVSHFHLRYSSYGTGVKENMNTVGFIRHDDRKEFDTNLRHTFWINRLGFDSVQPSVNYNQYWSQSGYLRSWTLDTDVEISLYKRVSLELAYETDFKAEYDPYFEKDFNNHEWGCDFGYDNNRGFSTSIEYKRGKIFDSDMEAIEGGLEVKLLEAWDLSYFAEKTWLSPTEPGENSWIHYIRSSYYLNTDLYFKVFYQTRYELNSFWRDPDFELQRKTLQLLMVWRFLPPFGSLQLAYQEGTTRFTEDEGRGRTLFTKLSWVF
ncbi:carbohydrate binding family 9 domain-containing protein [candidate division KSB1 bacterium]|nr:carbohydrate binding family 9 domain-containing protein [candidate division KSB1 bacterium]